MKLFLLLDCTSPVWLRNWIVKLTWSILTVVAVCPSVPPVIPTCFVTLLQPAVALIVSYEKVSSRPERIQLDILLQRVISSRFQPPIQHPDKVGSQLAPDLPATMNINIYKYICSVECWLHNRKLFQFRLWGFVRGVRKVITLTWLGV